MILWDLPYPLPPLYNACLDNPVNLVKTGPLIYGSSCSVLRGSAWVPTHHNPSQRPKLCLPFRSEIPRHPIQSILTFNKIFILLSHLWSKRYFFRLIISCPLSNWSVPQCVPLTLIYSDDWCSRYRSARLRLASRKPVTDNHFQGHEIENLLWQKHSAERECAAEACFGRPP